MGRSRSTPGLVESKGKEKGPMNALEMHKKEITSASTATLLPDEECDKALLAERNALAGEVEAESVASEDTLKGGKQGQNLAIGSASPQQYAQVLSSQSPALLYPAPGHPHLLAPNVTLMNFDNRGQAGLYQSSIPFYHTGQYTPYCGLSPAASTNHLSIPSNSVCIGTPSPSNYLSEENASVSGQVPSAQAELQSQDALLSEIKRLRERLLTLETENASMSMKLIQQKFQVENRYA